MMMLARDWDGQKFPNLIAFQKLSEIWENINS